jgi:hypothetical protein
LKACALQDNPRVKRGGPFQRDLRWDYGYELLRTFAFDYELDLAVHQSEQGVVFAHANTFAGAHWRAALTNDDATSIDRLTAINLNAEAL